MNTAQTDTPWQKFFISAQQLQALQKQITPEASPYANLQIPSDWAEYEPGSGDSITALSEQLSSVQSAQALRRGFDYDFIAYNNSATSTGIISLASTQLVYVTRDPLAAFENELTLDGLIEQLQQRGQPISGNPTLDLDDYETIRRINLTDREGLETTAVTTVDSVPVKVVAYYLIQDDGLYIVITETYGEQFQQESGDLTLRKIAQSFRLTSDESVTPF